jgi:hypothetical protein
MLSAPRRVSRLTALLILLTASGCSLLNLVRTMLTDSSAGLFKARRVLTRSQSACAAGSLILLLLSGCSFLSSASNTVTNTAGDVSNSIETPLARTGLYLHDDSYQQKADSAVADFNKIDLSSKFDAQFKTVTSYDNDEDQAVASLQVASRNLRLQDFIALPAWQQTCPDQGNPSGLCCVDAQGNPAACSGDAGLKNEVHRKLHQITGAETLSTNQQRLDLRGALYLAPEVAKSLEDKRESLADDIIGNTHAGGHGPPNPCSPEAPRVSPAPVCDETADATCYSNRIKFDCGDIAGVVATQNQIQANLWVFNGELRQLLDVRKIAIKKRENDQADADKLAAQIAQLADPKTQPDQFATTLADVENKLGNSSSAVSAVAKYFGYTALANQLESVLTSQVKQNAPPPKSDQTPAATPNQKAASQPKATATPQTNQVQTLIDLATNVKSLADDYGGKDPNARVGALLLAKAAAQHQADMAKLDADYQADLIVIYDAEINARLRQAIDLDNADQALATTQLPEHGLVEPTPFQIKRDALAAWVASQDEGEIPYQVLAAKEVQLLRAQSVKQGQLSAKGYESIITTVLAQLDAYAKGGVTKEAIVQALGFIGVITSISVK